MTPQERIAFEKYVHAGRTLVRYEDHYDGNDFEIQGIVMETYPYAINDQDSFGHYQMDMLTVAWFDGDTNTFPLCLLDFNIDGEWWDVDDITLGEVQA